MVTTSACVYQRRVIAGDAFVTENDYYLGVK